MSSDKSGKVVEFKAAPKSVKSTHRGYTITVVYNPEAKETSERWEWFAQRTVTQTYHFSGSAPSEKFASAKARKFLDKLEA